jgi:hypothetical protein
MIELEGENHRLIVDDQTFYCCLCDITAPFSFVPRLAVKIDFLPTSHFVHQHFQEKTVRQLRKIPSASFSIKCLMF